MAIYRVALDVPLPKLFDYAAAAVQPEDVGYCVRVPFGSSHKVGVIVEIAETSEHAPEKLKAAGEVLRDLPRLPADWLELVGFCSRYYQRPLGEVIAAALPPALRRGKPPSRRTPAAASSPAAQQAPHVLPESPPELLPEQAAAIETVHRSVGRYEAFLLHGVTASGKTEVYLRLIEHVLARGLQALMLVPEIALTPQLEARVARRFPHATVVAAHSGLTPAARARGFILALEGRADIVLGTRLAAFAPLPRLGIVIVDEEHDASFKQQDGLRYSARDVAVWRAHQRGVPILLGSATPSLESLFHARNGRYRLLRLPRRARAATMPSIRCIDTRREKLDKGFSTELIAALTTRLERGEQSLVFLNRRGYAPVLACPACGWISRCSRCAANMVLHLADRRLRCHHCGREDAIPPRCPCCGNADIHPFGRGTQRVAEFLRARFPQARVLRIDRDSAGTAQKSRALFAEIHEQRADIVVGTQMLAKGHDFAHLTLVGVLSADASLFAADFRAPERLFSQLLQVAGRSGRALLPGEVLIQTEHPQHPLYQALAAHDYARFSDQQLAEREAAGFPPFSFQAMLRAESKSLEEALAFLDAAVRQGRELLPAPVRLYDPVPMRVYRLMSLERAQLLIESTSRPALHGFLDRWLPRLRATAMPRVLRWHIDVDPHEL